MMWKAVLWCICVITGFQTLASGLQDGIGLAAFNRSVQRPVFYRSVLLKDSVKNDLNREAKRAALFSTLLPGLGQAYNRKYWKIPVIYGVAGGLGYLSIGFNKQYKDYRQALIYRYDDDPSTNDDYSNLTGENLVLLKKKYKKRRDLCYIGMGLAYVLNIVDASVDAHLRKFDEKINEKLSLSVRPCSNVMMTLQQPVYYSGVKFRLNF